MEKGQGKGTDTLQTDNVYTRKEYIERNAAISVIVKISNESDMPVDWHRGNMSILIKGMEMPEHCGECKLKAEYDDETFCPFFADNVEYWIAARRRHEECPLSSVPPHGRLIDADALMKEMDKQENAMYEHGREFSFSFKSGGDVCTAWYNVEMMVEDAPTIITASEEGAKTKEDTEPWLCLSCRHYPPSPTDGKPCTQCNPSEVWHSCYDPAEEGE